MVNEDKEKQRKISKMNFTQQHYFILWGCWFTTLAKDSRQVGAEPPLIKAAKMPV